MEEGRLKRLIINMPPQHGKSEQVTVRFAGYLLECDPRLRIIVGAYNEQFATRFGRKTKRLLKGRVDLASDQRAAQDWETTSGGSYLSVGVGSGATGRPADLLIIDDPIKNRLEAESIRQRDTVWEWFTESLYTRLQPGAPVIIQMTRWHEDDLVGRLLNSGEIGSDWVRVNLPALALADDPLGRGLGEALCPDRFGESALDDRRKLLGEYAFQALYQGNPSPREGSLFRVDRIVVLPIHPSFLGVTLPLASEGKALLGHCPGQDQAVSEGDSSLASEGNAAGRRVLAWDLAATENDGDWTAAVLMERLPDGRVMVEPVRFRHEPHQRNERIRREAERLRPDVVRIPRDPGAAGKESVRTLAGVLAGFAVKSVAPTGSKAIRAEPFAAQVNAGNVVVVGPFAREYIEELRQFPLGKHDDWVDASSDAFSELVGDGWLDMSPSDIRSALGLNGEKK